MASPPDTIEPSELWLALTTLPRPHRVVPFPRTIPGTDTPVGEIAIWPLTQEEQMAANAEADRFTKKLLKDPQHKDQANLGYHHTYANEVAVQVVYRACRDPGQTSRAAFPGPSAIRERLTTDEVGVLFNHYCTVASEIGPIVANLTRDELEAWIVRLQEGGSAFPFDLLSWEAQRSLILFMASQLMRCWTVMCSLGSPPDVNSHTLDLLRERVAAMRPDPESPAEATPDNGE